MPRGKRLNRINCRLNLNLNDSSTAYTPAALELKRTGPDIEFRFHRSRRCDQLVLFDFDDANKLIAQLIVLFAEAKEFY